MKFCKYCGKQLDDNAKFCKECGALSGSAVNAAAVVTAPQPIEPERTAVSAGQDAPVAAAVVPAPQPIEPERTAVTSEPDAPVSAKKKKGKVICILIAVAVIIGAVFAGVTIYNWYNSNEQKFIRAIDAGEYEEAFELVKTDETLKDNEALAEKLLNRIDAVKNDYCEETIAYSDALLDLDAIQRMGISEILDKIADTRRYLAQLNQSRICFSSAETFFKEGNFEDAMDLYAQVVEEDGNYEAARKQYSESVNRYREQMLNKAAEYAKNDEYSSAIEILDTALIHLPDDHAITEQRLLYENAEKEVFKAKLLENAAAYASEGRYLSAINLLDTYYNSVDAEDTDINLLRQEYCDQYAESVLSEAQKEVDNNAYQSAIDMVNSALAVTGKNELLSNAVKQYKNMYVEYAIKMADECATDDGIALLCGAWTGQPTPEGSIDCLWELESPMPETLQSRERLALRLTLCLQTTRFYFDGSECHVLKSLRPVGELTATAERSESVIRAYAGSASLGGVPLRAEATVSAIHAALTLTARDGLLADADAWRPFLLTDADTGEAFDLEFSQLEPDSAMAEFAGIGHVPERLLLSIVAEEEASGDAPRLLNDQPILLKP